MVPSRPQSPYPSAITSQPLLRILSASTTIRPHFEYDALQRRTKMVDAIGTTTYTYTVGSGMSLIAEDGPWASDTLTVTHRLGRRLGLHLQQYIFGEMV